MIYALCVHCDWLVVVDDEVVVVVVLLGADWTKGNHPGGGHGTDHVGFGGDPTEHKNLDPVAKARAHITLVVFNNNGEPERPLVNAKHRVMLSTR